MENTELENVGNVNDKDEDNEISLTRYSLGSDAYYDDDLEVPDSIQIVDIGNGPIAIEKSEDENEGTYS